VKKNRKGKRVNRAKKVWKMKKKGRRSSCLKDYGCTSRRRRGSSR
jgi:hypothetical protein